MIDPTGITRRRLLGNSAKLAAAAFASTLLPPNLRKALAATSPLATPTGSLQDIKHVVLLMQENRSFDHYFGSLAGVRGFGDTTAMTLSHGKSVFHQPDVQTPDGYLLPFHLDTRSTSAQKVPSTSHAWATQHASWNDGKMDNWLGAHRKADGHAKGPFCMGYYTRDDIPFQYALADAFTICDAYHCSVLGPTWPNRLYWMTGSIDPDGHHGGPVIRNKDNEYSWTTYAERLEAAGVNWKVYNQPLDKAVDTQLSDTPGHYPFNMLGHFKQFYESPANSPLRHKALTADTYKEFAGDVMNDRLPTVSWIMPPRIASEHPDHMPAAGAAFVAKTIDAIAANPKVWAKTAFILNYDENDGIFDHVAPPTPPKGTPHEFINGQPIGGGFRVPCIIVSPWTAGGWVCSQPFDHTSILQFVEKLTGVREANITDWRRQTFGDLTAAFRFDSHQAVPPKLPDTARALALAEEQAAHLPLPSAPKSNQSSPVQEEGKRKQIKL
jgi:phospholipase C